MINSENMFWKVTVDVIGVLAPVNDERFSPGIARRDTCPRILASNFHAGGHLIYDGVGIAKRWQ